jgi:hypothetical protein
MFCLFVKVVLHNYVLLLRTRSTRLRMDQCAIVARMCLGDRAWGDLVKLRALVHVMNFRARMPSACRSSRVL